MRLPLELDKVILFLLCGSKLTAFKTNVHETVAHAARTRGLKLHTTIEYCHNSLFNKNSSNVSSMNYCG